MLDCFFLWCEPSHLPDYGWSFFFRSPLGSVFSQSQHPIHADSREDTFPLSHRLFDRMVGRPSWPSRPPPPISYFSDDLGS